MAVAPHALASQSALAVLREGGNAVEAMIAAAATIAVVYPHMNSIGGDSFWLVHVPGREPQGIDACGAAAQAASIRLVRGARHQGRDPVPRRHRGQHRRRHDLGLGACVRDESRARRQAAALAPARGCDPLRQDRDPGDAQPAREHHHEAEGARAAAGVRRGVPSRRRRPGHRGALLPAEARRDARAARARGARRLLPRRARALDRSGPRRGRITHHADRPRSAHGAAPYAARAGAFPRQSLQHAAADARRDLACDPRPARPARDRRARPGRRGLRASRGRGDQAGVPRDPRPAHHRSGVHEGRRAVAPRAGEARRARRRRRARPRGAVGPGQAALRHDLDGRRRRRRPRGELHPERLSRVRRRHRAEVERHLLAEPRLLVQPERGRAQRAQAGAQALPHAQSRDGARAGRPHDGLRQHGRRRPAADAERGVQPHARARHEPAGGDRGAEMAPRPHLGPDERYAQARVALRAGGRGRAAPPRPRRGDRSSPTTRSSVTPGASSAIRTARSKAAPTRARTVQWRLTEEEDRR